MANLKKRVPEDAPGDFFVDTTCIDCDTCRQLAPAVFGEAPGHAFVRRQPATPEVRPAAPRPEARSATEGPPTGGRGPTPMTEDRRRALHALVCCPTGSIGSLGDDRPQSVMDDFPL